MKKLLIILVLCAMCICSCTTDAPPAESSAESSTEATTTAATETTPATEDSIDPDFVPDRNNVIWGDPSHDFINTLDLAMNKIHWENKITAGELYKSEYLLELMEVSGDKRIAVDVMFFRLPEGGVSVYSNFSDEHQAAYKNDMAILGDIYFLTADEINRLVCDPEAEIALTSLSYRGYFLYAKTAGVDMDSDIVGTSGELKEGEFFQPDKSNVIWAFGSGLSYSECEYGTVKISDSLEKTMETAGDRRIAVSLDLLEYSQDNKDAVFSRLPEGYSEIYGVKFDDSCRILFMTVDEIKSVVCDSDMKVSLDTISYEAFYEG